MGAAAASLQHKVPRSLAVKNAPFSVSCGDRLYWARNTLSAALGSRAANSTVWFQRLCTSTASLGSTSGLGCF